MTKSDCASAAFALATVCASASEFLRLASMEPSSSFSRSKISFAFSTAVAAAFAAISDLSFINDAF